MRAQRKETYSPDLCQFEVTVYDGNWPRHHQCTRKHLPGGQFCKIHSPEAIETRRKATEERERSKMRKWELEWRAPRMLEALKKIADGDNNPRETAAEAIKGLVGDK